jgi:hypothetical protein
VSKPVLAARKDETRFCHAETLKQADGLAYYWPVKNAPEQAPGHLIKPPIMFSPRFSILVAASVSEWFLVHSLTLAATPTKPEQAPGYQTQRE